MTGIWRLNLTVVCLLGCICCGHVVAQECSPNITSVLVFENEDGMIAWNGDVPQIPSDCPSTQRWTIMSGDAALFTSIEILNFNEDPPDAELRATLFTVNSPIPVELTRDTQTRLFVHGDAYLEATFTRAGNQSNSDYGFHFRLSLTKEADCGDDFLCSFEPSEVVVCFNRSVRCDNHVHCIDITDETNCDYCGETEIDLGINQEVSIEIPDLTSSYVCLWRVQAPPSSRMLLLFTNYDLSSSAAFIVSVSNLTVGADYTELDSSDILFLQAHVSWPIVPRVRAITNDTAWIVFFNYRMEHAIFKPSTFRLLVSALNETVECASNEFLCDTGIQCVPNNTRCDGQSDCDDFSDELGCSETCRPGELSCMSDFNEVCLPVIKVCNSFKQCDDLRDEIDCAPSCGSHVVHLQRNQTHQLVSPNAPSSYPDNIICVWLITAPDGTKILISTVKMVLSGKTNISVGDGPLVDPSRIIWRRGGGTAPRSASSEGHEVWITLEDVTHRPSNFNLDTIPLNVHFIIELSVLDGLVNCSGEHSVTCENGLQCINASHVCDGVFHCWDYSDELSCGHCESHELLCPSLNCVSSSGICDGLPNCADFLDETSCANVCGSERYINLKGYTPDNPYNISSLRDGYPPLTACVWIFTTTPGQRILLMVKYQNTSQSDVTTVGNGVDPGNLESQLGEVRRTNYQRGFASLNNSLWMTFLAPDLEQSKGQIWYQLITFNDSVPCGENLFRCESSGLCIDSDLRCNRVADCVDYSDEKGCDNCGGPSFLNVTDGRVHDISYKADDDGIRSPHDLICIWQIMASPGHRIKITLTELQISVHNNLYFGEGEIQRANYFTGSQGTTGRITSVSKTDDVFVMLSRTETSRDLFTIEIEQFQTIECGEGEIPCPSGLTCILKEDKCDGTPQCPLLGDEIGCDVCSAGEYRCSLGPICIDTLTKICDGIQQCADKTDETGCILPCGVSDVKLNNETAPSSPFSSLNHPLEYLNDLQCYWLVTADPDSVVVFEIRQFQFELSYDKLKIGNGLDITDQSSVIVVLTGSLSRAKVSSKTFEAWATFTSDSSITYMGFSGVIRQTITVDPCRGDDEEFSCKNQDNGLVCLSVEAFCNGYADCKDSSDERNCGECGVPEVRLIEDKILLNSPGYPLMYPDNLNCLWQIIPEFKNRYRIRIIDFELEEGYDYVTFIDGNPSEPNSEQIIKFTGLTITTRSLVFIGDIWVNMKTDSSRGFKGFSVTIAFLQDNETTCDGNDFDCLDRLCVDNNAVCNGFRDCTNNQDENDCDEIVCPGAYKCDNFSTQGPSVYTSPDTRPSMTTVTWSSSPGLSSSSTSFYSSSSSETVQTSFNDDLTSARCVSLARVCDGENNCPELDDETECDTKKCPAVCECNYRYDDLNVTCANGWNSTVLSGVAVTTHFLQLSRVDVPEFGIGAFKAFKNLKVLSLRGNNVSEIHRNTFVGLDKLLWLDLSNTSLRELQGHAMEELRNLQGITIFNVPLRRIRAKAFVGLSNVKTMILVRQVEGLPRLEVDDGAFDGLTSLSKLYVDDHTLCCFFKDIAECKTLEPGPPLFMCSQLMPNLVLKVFMWILGISALVGNIFVMIWRCREKTAGRASRKVHSLLVFNLAVSDALMGVYMLTIAVADVYFGERYFETSSSWQTSIPCKLAGFVSIVASEASVFFLTLISIDRFLSIVYPFSSHHIRPKSGRMAACFIWICTVIVGLIPTILAWDSTSDVYGLSDVCIGLPLMTKVTSYEPRQQTIDAGGVANITVEIPVPVGYRASWFYSIALFLGVNLLCFCVILVCYICIFVSVKMSMKRVRRHKNRDDEIRMAIKMAAIVMTDFICWFPVIIMGILSQGRIVVIPPEAYAWIVVFILPINSSLNPYLYTISDFCSQRRRSAKKMNTAKHSNVDNSRNSASMDTVFTIVPANKKDST